MKLRIKFAKVGSMKFVGHLDIMRYFQKANRRAEFDVSYSTGFSPHQKMSFAAPLGVGLTSLGEYFDLEVNSATSSEDMIKRYNDTMVEEIKVLNVVALPDSAKNSMSLVAAADYLIKIKDEYLQEDYLNEDLIATCLGQNEINILKKTKKNEKVVDIKPLIYDYKFNSNELVLRLSQGSENNLKPDMVLKAICEFAKREYNPYIYQIMRIDTLAINPEYNETNNFIDKLDTPFQKCKFVPLDYFGNVF